MIIANSIEEDQKEKKEKKRILQKVTDKKKKVSDYLKTDKVKADLRRNANVAGAHGVMAAHGTCKLFADCVTMWNNPFYLLQMIADDLAKVTVEAVDYKKKDKPKEVAKKKESVENLETITPEIVGDVKETGLQLSRLPQEWNSFFDKMRESAKNNFENVIDLAGSNKLTEGKDIFLNKGNKRELNKAKPDILAGNKGIRI